MKTTVDWLKFRTTQNPFKTLAAIAPAFGTVAELLTLGEPAKGKDVGSIGAQSSSLVIWSWLRWTTAAKVSAVG